MAKTKKILLSSLSIALIAVIAILGTVAYLTDTEEAVNVMTVGNVNIELIEQQRSDGPGSDLEPFENNKVLMPIVGSAQGDKDNWGLPIAANYVDKIVSVENTGKSDAYVRVIVGVPAELEAETPDGNVLHWNTGNKFIPEGENQVPDAQYSWQSVGTQNVDGVVYNLYVFNYPEILTKGEITTAAFVGFYLDSKVDYDPDTDIWTLGDTVISYDLSNGVYIPVMAQAVQAEGFGSLDSAFTASGLPVDPWGKTTAVNTADGLVEALEASEDIFLTADIKIDPANMSNAYGKTGINVKNGQTIDGGGNVLDIRGAGGTWDSGINTTGGLIKNITVTGSFRGIFINHNSTHSEPVVLENVTIDGTVYTISCDQGTNQGLTATASTFNGWTSYAASLGIAKFVDCYFGEGSGYAFLRPYAPTEFIGCEFEAGYEMDPRAAVTFENCTLNGVALTADNLATLVTSNISNATVK